MSDSSPDEVDFDDDLTTFGELLNGRCRAAVDPGSRDQHMPSQDGESEALSAATASQSLLIPLSEEVVIQEFVEVEDDPARFRDGVEAYAPFVEGTHLPEAFRHFRTPSKEVSPSTFLSLIVSCVPTWFEKSKPKKSEKSDQKSKRFSKAEADLAWLLELIRDYIRLTRQPLAHDNVEIIINHVTDFCQAARNEEQVNYGTEILFELSKRVDISLEDLRKVLIVLTATAKALSRVPKPLEVYLRFLLTGISSEICLNELEKLISVPSRDNETEGLPYARGACRLLGAAIEYQNRANEYVVQLSRFIDLLYEAATRGIFRLSRDILNACECIIASEARRDELLTAGFSTVIATSTLCIELQPPDEKNDEPGRRPPQSMLSISSAASALSRQTIDGQIARRFVQADAVGKQLEAIWDQLADDQRFMATDYVLHNPRFNPESLVLRCLDLTIAERLCCPNTSGWRVRLDCLEAHFVKDQLLSSKPRIKAIELLKSIAKVSSTDETASGTTEATQHVLRMLRDQFSHENDQGVFDASLTAIPFVMSAIGTDDESAFDIQETITTLETFVLETAKTSVAAADVTRSLVESFRNLFQSHPKQALSAFESLAHLAGTECRFSEARIEAMRLLLRLRSTISGSVYLNNSTESEYVAVMLCRTTTSSPANVQESKPQRRSTNSSSSANSGPPESAWVYDSEGEKAPKSLLPSKLITADRLDAQQAEGRLRLDIGAWLTQAVTCLRTDPEWETYSYLMVHLGSQLANVRLFRHSLGAIVKLRQVICEQIANGSFKAPPAWTGLKKDDIGLCLFNVLTPLIAYASIKDAEIDNFHFSKELVQAFMAGMNDVKFDGAFRGCVHALSVCSLEFPEQVGREYPRILDTMTRTTTKSHWSIHMLEFLSQVAILPEVHKNFSPSDKRQIFGICMAVLNAKRDEQLKQQEQQEHGANLTVSPTPRAATASRFSGLPNKRPPYRAQMLEDAGVPLYASALAYHTMICWFLSLTLKERPTYAPQVIRNLVWYDKHNEAVVDQQAEVFRDMMLRTTYSDLGETMPDPAFSRALIGNNAPGADVSEERTLEQSDGKIDTASWLVGYSIVTLETAGHSGRTQVTKRQASGTTYATYKQSTRPVPPHQEPSTTAIVEDNLSIEMLPQHVMLQLQITAAPVSVEEQPIPLPNDEAVDRALRIFDLNATIDSHKAGVLFVGPGQSQQGDIMSNVAGSADYEEFLSGLGYKVSLRTPCGLINPQGLRHPTDGEETVAWCDRVTEIVFLVPTMMPLDVEEEYEWLRRWANVGNSYVNIIFNQSGQPWRLDNLKSQFNYVNIVISPTDWNDGPVDAVNQSHEVYYQVQVMTKEGFPNISPAADPKLVSAKQLPRFVRVLAISACVFSQAWEKKDQDTEFHSPWRDRLIAIKEMRKKYGGDSGQQDRSYGAAGGPSHSTVVISSSSSSGRRTPVPRDEPGPGQETQGLISRMDFTRWMGFKAASDRTK